MQLIKRFIILLSLYSICFSNVYAASDVGILNSYVFYPDITTHIKGIPGANAQRYLMLRVVVITFDKLENPNVEYYEPQLRDQVLDIFNGSDATAFMSTESRHAVENRIMKAINKTSERELGYKIAKRVVLKRIIIE